MTTTIVISTYNGAKFIEQQLDSIRLQTRKADYVIISDDCSTDSTPQIVIEYIKKNDLTNWTFLQNKKNVGWKVNFHNLLLSASTDIIYLCDQDDIWHEKKLELMTPYFENKEINLLCCKQRLESKDFSFNTSCKENIKLLQPKFNNKFMWPTRPSCTYAVRREYFLSIDNWWKEYLPHDAFLFRNAMLDDSLFFLESELIIRRIHESNASIPHGSDRFKINLQYYIDVCNLLITRSENDTRIKNKE
ncbi:MAG: glycosyltransferase [Treponema sp.]|nr:glycosyltransferase [Treponema sp.]